MKITSLASPSFQKAMRYLMYNLCLKEASNNNPLDLKVCSRSMDKRSNWNPGVVQKLLKVLKSPKHSLQTHGWCFNLAKFTIYPWPVIFWVAWWCVRCEPHVWPFVWDSPILKYIANTQIHSLHSWWSLIRCDQTVFKGKSAHFPIMVSPASKAWSWSADNTVQC